MEEYSEGKEKNGLDLPLRSDGSEYTIEGLTEDQQVLLAEVLEAVKKYVEQGPTSDIPTFRITVCGVAGSGKSTWINTLVTILRKMFECKESVFVFGPTGSAAYNAGGETIHRGLGVKVDMKNLEVSEFQRKRLLQKLSPTVAVIFDEKSMIDGASFGMAEHNCQQYAHGGRADHKPWGGIPIIILVGDDYQLPSVSYGAFYALCPKKEITDSVKTPIPKIIARSSGFEEFKLCGKRVGYLKSVKRVNDDQEQLKRILNAVRCEDENVQLCEEDIQRLLELHIYHKRFSREERKQIEKDATYVFANKEPRNSKNRELLKKENENNIPIARIVSQTTTYAGKKVNNDSHFDADREPSSVMICKNAIVSLNGYNPEPLLGLYHGSLGRVLEIVFEETESPNLKHLPKYVLVEFFQYKGKELVPGLPKVIPIVPITVHCKYFCCKRKLLPLALAFGKTSHTFQGTTVGPVPPGKPPNAIQKIIIDPGSRSFEGINVGLLYQLLGRPTTIGTKEDKFSSAMYFTGPHFNRDRITNLTLDKNKKLYKKAALRKQWVEYLKKTLLIRAGGTKT